MAAQKLSDEIVDFFRAQNFIIVSTLDKSGTPHCSCKGIVEITTDGSIFLLDLYKGQTFSNLTANARISITAVDEHKFRGYCLKGSAQIVPASVLDSSIIKAWEQRIAARITQRLVRNISGEKGHPRHPEALLPKPEYLISVEVVEVVDLTPRHFKREA